MHNNTKLFYKNFSGCYLPDNAWTHKKTDKRTDGYGDSSNPHPPPQLSYEGFKSHKTQVTWPQFCNNTVRKQTKQRTTTQTTASYFIKTHSHTHTHTHTRTHTHTHTHTNTHTHTHTHTRTRTHTHTHTRQYREIMSADTPRKSRNSDCVLTQQGGSVKYSTSGSLSRACVCVCACAFLFFSCSFFLFFCFLSS